MNPLLSIRELASDVLVERLGWVLVHSLWQFTLIVFAAAIVVRLLGRRQAAARYAVLVGAMAALAVSPVVTWFLQPEGAAIAEIARVPDLAEAPIATAVAPAAARMNDLHDEPADAALAVNLPAEELPANPALLAIPEVPVAAPAPLSWAEAVERTLRPWLAWIVVGWSLGVVLCSLRPLLGWHALWRLRRVGVSPVGEEISAALRRVAGQLGLRRAVQVLQSTLVQTPVLVGYFRPAILLPVGLATGLPISQLEAILAHELAHVRRHDFVVNLLQTLVETLCFYHPAVWWLSRQIRVEREHCCDDLVVGLLGNRVEYGRALLAVEELRGTSSVLALGMADGVLLSRVRRLFGARSDLSTVRPGERWVVLALAALGLLVTLLGVRTGLNVGRNSDVEPAQFSVTLPNGTVVELLGVATGEKDSPWWRPDGTPMSQPPLTGLPIATGFEPAKNCRSFAVRIRGAGSDDSWMAADGAKQFHSVGRGNPGGVVERVMTTDALPQQDLGTLRVGVERGEFGPPQPVSSAGRKIIVTLPENLRPWYDAVPLPRVEEVDGKVRLVFPPPDFSQHRHFVEWSVVDVDGNRSLTFDLPLSRVGRFEYRLQPRKHWVTFENVSLQPGKTSEVKVSTEPPPRPGAFVAKLPGDIAVELVGVGPHPSKDKPWWKPDGSPLEPRPELEGGFSVMSGSPEQAQCREFLIHIRGLPREHAVTTDYGPVSAATGSSYSNGLWVGEHGAGPFKSDTTSVRVGLTTEPYGPTVEIDITGTRQPAELSADLQPFYDRIVPLRVEEVDGQTELILDGKASNNLFKEAAWELHAVDVDGEKHHRSSESVTRSGERHFTFKLPRNRIARFEYRLRPYRHWATFENVSLEPGRTTEVKVSTESQPAPRPERYSATLPDGVKVLFVGITKNMTPARTGWRPDGLPLEDVPEWPAGMVLYGGNTTGRTRPDGVPIDSEAHDFLFEFQGLKSRPSFRFAIPATGASYSYDPIMDPYRLRISGRLRDESKFPGAKFDPLADEVRVGLTTEPWGKWLQVSPTGEVLNPLEPGDLHWSSYSQVKPQGVVQDATESTRWTLNLDQPGGRNRLYEFEIRWIDNDRAEHQIGDFSSTRQSDNGPSREKWFVSLPAGKELARFEYRLRPFRHWVTFKGVSLEAGKESDVKVSVETVPVDKPRKSERYSATLPDGVKVSFVGITKNTAPAKEGWRPDGLPLGDVPEWPAGFAVYGGQMIGTNVRNHLPLDANGRDFLFEFHGLHRQPSVKLVLPCDQIAYPDLPVREPYRLRVSGRLAQPSESNGVMYRPLVADDEVRVGLSDEPWGKWVQIGLEGELLTTLDATDLYRSSYAQLHPQRVAVSDKAAARPVLRLQQRQRYEQRYHLSVRAIDTDGLEQLVLFGGSKTVETTDFIETEWRLLRALPAGKQLARFEYRLRPYRHWVTFKGVSLEAGKESDVKVSVETVQATADFPRPRPEDVRGLDLSRAAVRHYSEATRLSPEQQTPELLVPGSDPAEPWRRPKNVFLMPLAENIWLKYPAGSGHFYINHRPDGTWQHERMYGPIEGDPFELLKLEELFREQLKPGATGGDARYRLTLMFRTGDSELIRRAWRLIEPELIVETTGPDAGVSVAGSSVRYTEQDPWRFERIESLGRVREALRDEAEAFRRPELTDVAARMREIVAAAEEAIDATNDAVPDTTYESVTYLQPGLKAKIPAALWGPPLDGLRLGLVPSDGIDWSKWQQLPTDKPLPMHITALSGDELQYLVMVENVSDREIKLSGYIVGQEMARGLEMLDQNGRPVDIENLHASTLHIRSYWRLKPGERQLLTMPAVNLTSAPVDPAERRLGYSIKAVPGHHTLRCTIRFGNLDNERHRYVPGKSEWIGELSTGTQKITVAERVLDAGEDPAADQSVSLVDAVRDFNAANKQRGRGQEQPPLTEEEVVAAIQRSDWKRDTEDVSEREFAAFKAVAKTRRLPEGAKLEVLTGVQSDAFTTSQLWSIRLIMPALERAGTVGFSIRHTVLGEEKIDPEQVAWGKPDADGLSLGLFLSPRKAQYPIGERVQLRLFVRNEGRKAIDDLSFMNITWPVIEDFTVTDQTGARVAVWNGHEEWSGPQWIAGAIRSRLEAGEAYALRVPFEIGIGGEVDKPVGRILDAKPGQTLRLRVRAANGSERIRAADEPKPESGEVTLTVQTQTDAVDDAKNPSNRPAVPPRATLTGRFVYDGEAPPRKDLWPQFAEIDATQRQQPGPDGRFSGVEATYREFLKQNIRPSTLDPSLLVDKSGGVANVVVWVTSKEIPWTPPADLAQRPVTIRLQDGNFAPRMTVATVGQPVVVENLDPVPFNFHAEFSRALNSPVNMLLPARSDEQPPPINFRAAEPYPSRFRSDLGPWAGGLLMIHGNPYVAVSQPDGSFTLPDLPPGEWEFRVWHERSGYVRHWPQGRFKRMIQPGENDLGTIRLKPEVFGVKATVAGPPPSNREQIGEVGGKPVYRDEVTDATLHSVFLGAALERYRETHRAEIAPTDAELRSAGEYFDRKHRERLAAAGGEAKLREQMRTIETQLAAPGLPEEDQKQLELEHLRLRSQLRPPSDDSFARFLLNNWKLQKHLYENYGGGRILWQQAGLEAFDAMHRWMEAQEQAGVFKITDAALRARFYEYWTRDHGPFLTADKERIRQEFLEPEWLAPTPAKESPSAD